MSRSGSSQAEPTIAVLNEAGVNFKFTIYDVQALLAQLSASNLVLCLPHNSAVSLVLVQDVDAQDEARRTVQLLGLAAQRLDPELRDAIFSAIKAQYPSAEVLKGPWPGSLAIKVE